MRRPDAQVVTVVAGILVAALVASLWLAATQRRATADRLEVLTASLGSEFQTELTRIMDLGIDIEVALRGVDDLDHRSYAAVLDDLRITPRFPTLVGVSYVDRVRRSDLDTWLAQRQQEGDGFDLHTDAGEDVLRVIRYSYPLPRNAAAVGFDHSEQTASRQAGDLAVRTSTTQLSGMTWIVQLAQDEPGAVIHVPVLDEDGRAVATLGLVVAIDGLLAELEPLPAPVSVAVHGHDDGTDPVARIGGPASDPVDGQASTRDVGLGDRPWALEVRPADDFVAAASRRAPWLLGLAGILVATLAGLVVRATSSREQLANELAIERTQQLADANARLSEANDRLADLNERLAASNENLLAADRVKDEFLAAVSHELRTPLTVIGGFTEMLRRLPPGTASPASLLDPLERNVRRLDVLVADLLTLAGLDAGRVHPRPDEVALAATIDTLVTDLGPAAPDDVTLDVPAGLHTRVDPRHLDRILSNLLVNAARHGRAPVVVEAVDDGDGVVSLRVRDHGSGVADTDVTTVFDRFERGRATDRSTGTGLGLAIVRELSELNGGSVHYHPAEPGACFEVRLPLASHDAEVREGHLHVGAVQQLTPVGQQPAVVPEDLEADLAVQPAPGQQEPREHPGG